MPADWLTRATGFALDVLPGAAVVSAGVLVGLAVPVRGFWWWVCVVLGAAAILLTAANRVLLPSLTGWSLGRAATGIAVSDRAGGLVGAPRLLLRELAHLLDTGSVGVGWLWPLWDTRRRTFADLLTRTEVRRSAEPRATASRVAALVAATAVLVCVGVAAIGYFAVTRPAQAMDATRAQIYRTGPHLVEQLLSYDPQTLADDFARAQSVATAHYREQLVPQQQAVEHGKPLPNNYRAINSAVLSATPQHAVMLLFLQGSRGAGQDERLITATVRVTFVKDAGNWLVDDLALVPSAARPEGGDAGREGEK
ncbi:RDD family protein [Mycobacterium sp. M1]|uniref:RDD family protein n=1 Tax=Mycolicibacter acidiphilus TaxID=2835306 RepID=A0ABS5RN31_9MYCO|nr:RDD family protein [Mycolicibacter acidiphilus]